MKIQVEKLNLKQKEVTIATIDIENMYPSITFHVVKKDVAYYSARLPGKEKKTIKEFKKKNKNKLKKT